MEKGWSFKFRILIKKEDDLWVAYCLELDLVAASLSKKEVEKDIVAIIREQVRYSIVNDDMQNLFRDAPKEVWDEFRACEERMKPRQQEYKTRKKSTPSAEFPPISLVTNKCWSTPLATCCV
jgi:hypothetical protein